MTRWHTAWAGLGLTACAVVAALCVLPARWLLIAQPPDALISLADAQGTLWEGRAWIALGAPGQRRLLAEPVHWRWSGRQIVASHPWLQGPLTLTPALDGWRISAQNLRAPATVLTALGAPWNTLNPGGMLDLRWQDLNTAALAKGPLAQLRWQDASTALAPLPRIGNYVMRLQGAGGRSAALALATEGGLLQIDGQGSADAQGLQFSGRATFAPGIDASQRRALESLLSALGRRQGDVVSFGNRTAAPAHQTP
ncbi:general secretion pathway protein GspN [Bordetella genomosp. 12]|uniref:General secretion pathway protein GspN n=1 Tax=Bordetella genomosp. 12 TaxID=463035 RepID=A0A261VCM5_9BORD|nr:general secretion pathway protein GspN [Bordetella genomosp. 12]OZI71894.1 general secretion pathway protein GspN [Bordetella genomosp. 12]